MNKWKAQLYRSDRAAHDEIVQYVTHSPAVANRVLDIAKRMRGAAR